MIRIRKYRMRRYYFVWGFFGRGNCISKCFEVGVWLDERGEREGVLREEGVSWGLGFLNFEGYCWW